MILTAQGFDVTPFSDPLLALEALQTNAPDLLIADVVMPQLSGGELAIVVRETCPTCRVLLFSGHTATEQMLESARAQGYDFAILAKPVHPLDMLATVRSGLELNSRGEGTTASLQ